MALWILGPRMQKTRCWIFLLISCPGVLWPQVWLRGHSNSPTLWNELGRRRIFTRGFLHCRAQREPKEPTAVAWIHNSGYTHLPTSLTCIYMYTILTIYKAPHLVQTDQARLTQVFAFPDSNTSPRVTISVLGHVAVSQTCMTHTGAILAANRDYIWRRY